MSTELGPTASGGKQIFLSEVSDFVEGLARDTFRGIEALEEHRPAPLADMIDQIAFRVEAAKYEGQGEILQKLRAFVVEKSGQ